MLSGSVLLPTLRHIYGVCFQTIVSFIPFLVFGFWSLLATKLRKYDVIFVYILQGKMKKTEKNQKENHATKVTKIPKTRRRKYGMNETKSMYKHFLSDTICI